MSPRGRPSELAGPKMHAGVLAAAALLLIVVGGIAIYFLFRDPPEPLERTAAASAESVAPEQAQDAPININGIVLDDGSEVDPTDLLHLVRARVAGGEPPIHVKLLGIHVRRARLGKVDLGDENASVTYAYLVTHRDPRAEKERTAQRVTFTLRKDAPAVHKAEEQVDARTVPEPTCVWNAAWRAAIASGLSDRDHLDVTYGWSEKGNDAVWTFVSPDHPETRRVIDGNTCAIKLSK